jgi:hypothetical protein
VPDYFLNLPAKKSSVRGFGDMAVGVSKQLGPVGGSSWR